jgi:hypothetical protein
LLVNGCVEVDHLAPAAQVLPVDRIKDSASTRGQHNFRQLCQLVNDSAFPLAETGFTLKFENERDIDTGAGLDFMVAVVEGQTKLPGQLSTDGGFSGPHRTRQKKTARRFHAGQI